MRITYNQVIPKIKVSPSACFSPFDKWYLYSLTISKSPNSYTLLCDRDDEIEWVRRNHAYQYCSHFIRKDRVIQLNPVRSGPYVIPF